MARIVSSVLVFAIALAVASCGGSGTDPVPNAAPSVPVVSNASSQHLLPGTPPTFDFDFVWGASTDPEGDPIEYYGELYQTAGIPTFPFDFANDGTLYANSGWVTNLGWAVTGAPIGHRYVFRVKARAPSAESGWGVYEIVGNFGPSAPIVSNASSETVDPGPPVTYDFAFLWEASIDPDGDPLEYYGELYQTAGIPTFPFDFANDGTLYATSGWIDAQTWAVTGAPSGLLWYVFRVRARDASAETDWAVFENDMLGSCPFVFSWDGEKYAFESDVFPGGRLGTAGYQTYLRPYPVDYYVMTTTPALKEGAYEIQLTGERDEVDYLDEVQLLALYHSDATEVYAERAPIGVTTYPGIERLHTAQLPLRVPLSVQHVETGADVTDAVSAMDGTYVTLNEDPNVGYEYQTLELDLGDLSGAEQIKLIIDGQSVFPNTPEGAARRALFGTATRIEVQSASGTWAEVPLEVAEMPNLTGFRRVIVVDLTDAFPTDDYRLRLTWLFKSFVDAILVDTSRDEPFTAVPLPLLSADLHYRGISARTAGEKYELVYESISSYLPEHFPGAYTRYGDVRELLTDADDRFVIFFGGDEITLRFGAAPGPGVGELLGFAVMANGYYKDPNIDLPATVDPLPFAAMSNYPYPETESYPDDALHADYLRTWNTRVYPAEEGAR